MQLHVGKPVAFASRAPTMAERKYSQIRKELLAQFFGMEHNHHHMYVRTVILWTDHKLLVSISQKPPASVFKRLQHLLLWLQQYNCEICHKPGREMLLADTLLRVYYKRTTCMSDQTQNQTWSASMPLTSFLFQTTSLRNFRERWLVIQLYSL